MDGLSLIATWTEPFSLEGEEISYTVTVMNTATGVTTDEITVHVTRYELTDPIGSRDCAEYLFAVASVNYYSTSLIRAVKTWNIPTGNASLSLDPSLSLSLPPLQVPSLPIFTSISCT